MEMRGRPASHIDSESENGGVHFNALKASSTHSSSYSIFSEFSDMLGSLAGVAVRLSIMPRSWSGTPCTESLNMTRGSSPRRPNPRFPVLLIVPYRATEVRRALRAWPLAWPCRQTCRVGSGSA